jgi:predicted transcriptional regulator
MPGVARIRPKRPIHVYLFRWREHYHLSQKQLAERLGSMP